MRATYSGSACGAASVLLWRVHRAAGLTQARLATLAGTTQSSIVAYESGSREPSVPVLARMLAGTGHQLELDATPDPSLYRLADVARNLVASDPADDERFDAMPAAIAEDLSVHTGQVPPSWVHERCRLLDHAWWVSDLPSARAAALVHTPASCRRRGVMIDRHDLVAA